MSDVIDWAEEKAKEAAKAVLPDAAYNAVRNAYHEVVDPIHAAQKVAHELNDGLKSLTSGGALGAMGAGAGAGFFGGGNGFFGGDNTPTQHNAGQNTGNQPDNSGQILPGQSTSNSPSSDDSGGGIWGGIKKVFNALFDNPIGKFIIGIISLVASLFSGGGSFLSNISSALGFGSDDTPGGDVAQRLGTAIDKGMNTFRTLTHESASQIAGNAYQGIKHEAQTIGEGISRDWKSVKVSSKEIYAMGYLVTQEHLDPKIAAALAANFKNESALDPDQYGHGAEAKGKPGEAYGIGQWHPDRQADFKAWSGEDIHGSSLNKQLSFAAYEITHGKEQHAGLRMSSAGSAQEAGHICCTDYERAGDHVQEPVNRGADAQAIYEAYQQHKGAQQGIEVASSSTPLPSQTPPGTFLKGGVPVLGGSH